MADSTPIGSEDIEPAGPQPGVPEPGAAGSVTVTVTNDDTAIALGSGDVPVLGTPRVVALVEEAAVAAVAASLDAGSTSVGARVELDHLRPTSVGATVTAAAVLDSVDGPTLTFNVSVREDDREVARGIHRRVIVDRARFSS